MSRKQKLSKKIAHTLLAMAIVYSGGMNVLCNSAFAAAQGEDGADKNESAVLTDMNNTITYQGNNGGDSDTRTGGSGGHGGSLGADITGSEDVNENISVTATGGTGGNGSQAQEDSTAAYGGNGGDGGDTFAGITVSGANVTHKEVGLTVTGGQGGAGGDSDEYVAKKVSADANGSNGGAGGSAEAFVTVSSEAYTADKITLAATGGDGGKAACSRNFPGTAFDSGTDYKNTKIGYGGDGGAAMAAGIFLDAGSSLVKSVTVAELTINATGGKGGDSNDYSAYTSGALGGIGGAAEAYGIKIASLLPKNAVELNIATINVQATGGDAGATTQAAIRGLEKDGAAGGTARAVGVADMSGGSRINAQKIITEAVGGKGGQGSGGVNGNYDDRPGGIGGIGGIGGDAYAIGMKAMAGSTKIALESISVTATGGAGGKGGTGGRGCQGYTSNGGDGGQGGQGGNADARGLFAANSALEVTVDSITATAKGGAAGAAGAGGIGMDGGSGGSGGTAGTIGAEAKAYGIYAQQNAVVDLHAKTPSGTIKIGAKAENADATEAYAVYADNATVLFHNNATLNTSDGSIEDNTVLTSLNNATLGFGGTEVGRTVTGGTLQLAGSNTFQVNTKLGEGTADKFTFNSLASGSSTDKQYITVGYDATIDPYKVGSTAASGGQIDVLEITNLNGQNLENFTGGTTTLDSVLYQFNTTASVQLDGSGKKVQLTGVTVTKTPSASESVKTASDAQMALGSMWRIEGNNLMKRMGELRSDSEAAQGGVWARYYRGELSADSAYGREFNQDYTAFQGGIDKVQDYKGGKLYTGIAVNRIDSNAGYKAGSGDLSSTGVGLYASWLGSKGHYVDVIARGSKLANDFKLVDLSGNAAKGDYDTWAYGISAEYGYRQNLKAGWFVEPQAELSLGHINGADYEMSNGAVIKQDSVNSAVTRLGVLGGKEFSISGRPGNAYVKASVLHDFGGNGGATGYYQNDSLALQTGDLTGTWYELGLGANLGIAKNGNLYFDALKTFNGNLRTDWQFNAGLRFTF